MVLIEQIAPITIITIVVIAGMIWIYRGERDEMRDDRNDIRRQERARDAMRAMHQREPMIGRIRMGRRDDRRDPTHDRWDGWR